MGIPLYLAMTGAEFTACGALPEKAAWMACHFSLSRDGLSNLPQHLPPGSMVILDDSIPMLHHDPQGMKNTLLELIEQFSVEKILLDFQRSYSSALADLAQLLAEALPCPVGVSHIYGELGNLPVFLPAPAVITSLSHTVDPWKGQELWLEIPGICAQYSITESSCDLTELPLQDRHLFSHTDDELHLHYRIELHDRKADFFLQHDLPSYLSNAEKYGITAAVGLYRELKPK